MQQAPIFAEEDLGKSLAYIFGDALESWHLSSRAGEENFAIMHSAYVTQQVSDPALSLTIKLHYSRMRLAVADYRIYPYSDEWKKKIHFHSKDYRLDAYKVQETDYGTLAEIDYTIFDLKTFTLDMAKAAYAAYSEEISGMLDSLLSKED